ncbi:MAG: hypothetical protein JEZ00_10945 [Anaerolineaceae bacterium]|nr:hypothetical protein [Anaerolineaceae bacterium]
MTENQKKRSGLQRKGILLISGLIAPMLLYMGLSWGINWLSGVSAVLIAAVMLAVILVK